MAQDTRKDANDNVDLSAAQRRLIIAQWLQSDTSDAMTVRATGRPSFGNRASIVQATGEETE